MFVTRQITSAPVRLLVSTTNSPTVTVAERRTTAPCGKTITVRVSSCTGGSFPEPFEAAEYREACTVTGISVPAALPDWDFWGSFLPRPAVVLDSERVSFAVPGISKSLQRLRLGA